MASSSKGWGRWWLHPFKTLGDFVLVLLVIAYAPPHVKAIIHAEAEAELAERDFARARAKGK